MTSGKIEITFIKKENEFILVIKDNGIGIDEGRLSGGNGLGMSLIRAFTTQLGGISSFTNKNGSEFKILFPCGNNSNSQFD
jgi:two-component sensor histidine kinase